MAKVRVVAPTGQLKQCCRCNSIKDTSEFHRSAPRKDGRQRYCRTCKRVIDSEHNQRNPRRNYEHRREYALRNQRWLYKYQQKHTIGQFGYKKWLTEIEAQ